MCGGVTTANLTASIDRAAARIGGATSTGCLNLMPARHLHEARLSDGRTEKPEGTSMGAERLRRCSCWPLANPGRATIFRHSHPPGRLPPAWWLQTDFNSRFRLRAVT